MSDVPAHMLLFDQHGPKTRRRILVLNVVGVLIGLGLASVVAWVLAKNGQFQADKWLPLVQWDSWAYYFLPGLPPPAR